MRKAFRKVFSVLSTRKVLLILAVISAALPSTLIGMLAMAVHASPQQSSWCIGNFCIFETGPARNVNSADIWTVQQLDARYVRIGVATPTPTASPTPTPTVTPTPIPTPTPSPSPGSTAATFISTDTTTRGSWKGVYGADGYQAIADVTNLPAYAQLTVTGNNTHVWAPGTTDTRALQKNVGTDRIAAAWYSRLSFSINVNLTDGNPHRVAVYFLDWDSSTRVVQVDVVNASTNALLDSRTMSTFNGGKYLVWNLRGNVKFNIILVSGVNCVVSGLYFG